MTYSLHNQRGETLVTLQSYNITAETPRTIVCNMPKLAHVLCFKTQKMSKITFLSLKNKELTIIFMEK